MLKLNVSHQGFNPNWHEPARTRRLCNYGPSSVLQLVSFLTGIANMGWQWMCGLWCLYALMVPCVHLTIQCSCRVTVWPCWKKIRSGAWLFSERDCIEKIRWRWPPLVFTLKLFHAQNPPWSSSGWQWMCGLWCLYALMVPCVHLTIQCSCRVTVWPCWKKIRSGANMCSQGCNGHMVLDCLEGDFSGQTHHRIVGFWMNYIITGYKASNMWPARSWEQNSSLYVDDFW